MPSTTLRKTVLAAAQRVVVKMGTQLLSRPTDADPKGPGLDAAYLRSIARQIAQLRQRGMEVTLVSSGAIGAGCAELGLTTRPTDIAQQQAAAAVGQRGLMTLMHQAFRPHGLKVAQLLLTRADFEDRVRFLNLRNCITHLHRIGCVPVINENDTVAVDELRFGDNDMLAALVCNALRADALVLLTVVDGILDADGQRIDLITDNDDAKAFARTDKTAFGSGGITSKIEAARTVTQAGEIAVIAHGREPRVLVKLFDGNANKIGTVFTPASKKLNSRSRWIGLTRRPAGTIIVDDGADQALRRQGRSLLAIGIVEIQQRFDRGQVVRVRNREGLEIARGLTNYSADELNQIKGKRSNQIDKILGKPAYAEVIHRDNLVIH